MAGMGLKKCEQSLLMQWLLKLQAECGHGALNTLTERRAIPCYMFLLVSQLRLKYNPMMLTTAFSCLHSGLKKMLYRAEQIISGFCLILKAIMLLHALNTAV